jgi:IS4 transposase
VNARQLLRQYYPFLAIGKKGLVSLAIPGLFLAFSREVETPKGKRKRKVYRPVAVVAVLRLTEDSTSEVKELSLSADQEPPATYKGAYLLLSNRFDVPAEVVGAYQKRWRIEIFFRNAKLRTGADPVLFNQ